MSWESFVTFWINEGAAIVIAAIISAITSILIYLVSTHRSINKVQDGMGNISDRGSITAQNDRISGEIKAGNDKIDVSFEKVDKSFGKVDRSFEKLDSGITTLLIGDMEKKKDLEFLSKDQGRMLSSVEALVLDYTKMQVQVSELRRENSELMSSNEQLRNELSELRREVENQLGYEMEM